MSEKNIDRRVKYTKMVIRKSFLSILQNKPINKITIKEICEEADLNRATFYAHYADQYDLLHQIEAEFLEEIRSYLEAASYSGSEEEGIEILTKIFEYVKENADVCAVMLSDKGDIFFQKKVMMNMQTKFIPECATDKGMSQEDLEYLYTFVAVGCAGIIQKWMADGMKKSAREIAEMILLVTHKGLMSIY